MLAASQVPCSSHPFSLLVHTRGQRLRQPDSLIEADGDLWIRRWIGQNHGSEDTRRIPNICVCCVPFPNAYTHYCINDRPFDYAVIVGQLRVEENGSSVVEVLHIQPVYDPHEIYFHTLHVIFDTLRYERGNPVS